MKSIDFGFRLKFYNERAMIINFSIQPQYECKDSRESPRRSSKDVESENVSSSGQTTKIAIDTGTESSTEWNTPRRNSSLRKIENTPIRDTSSVLEKIGEFHKVKLISAIRAPWKNAQLLIFNKSISNIICSTLYIDTLMVLLEPSFITMLLARSFIFALLLRKEQ